MNFLGVICMLLFIKNISQFIKNICIFIQVLIDILLFFSLNFKSLNKAPKIAMVFIVFILGDKSIEINSSYKSWKCFVNNILRKWGNTYCHVEFFTVCAKEIRNKRKMYERLK